MRGKNQRPTPGTENVNKCPTNAEGGGGGRAVVIECMHYANFKLCKLF